MSLNALQKAPQAAVLHASEAAVATWGKAAAGPIGKTTAKSAVRADRIEFIDVARGLFIAWMIVGHSLSMTGVPQGHLLHLLRPSGWATYCFVMLTGLNLAVLYDKGAIGNWVASRRLWRRAFEIGLIAFLSNLVSRVITSSLSGEPCLSSVRDIVLLRSQWTMSGILLVPMAFLFLAPILLWCARWAQPLTYFVAVSTVVAGIDLFVQSHWFTLIPVPIQQSLTGGGLFFFPIVTFVVYSIWSFSLANLAIQLLRANGWYLGSGLLVVLVCVCFGIMVLSGGELRSFGCLSHFMTAIGFAFAITQLAIFAPLKDMLGPLGHVGLLIFILHRPILHLVFGGGNESFLAETLAVLMMAFALGLGLLLGLYRDRNARFSRALRFFGF
jgi:hypothetical protein